MWASITPADVDGDGKIDFILGNCGYNNQFKATEKHPMTMYAADFNNDGIIDPIVCYYINGKSYPMASKDELLDAIPSLKKRFIKYSDYADVTVNDIFSKEKIAGAKLLSCNQLASGILYNNGDDHFEFQPLPLEAQVSKVWGAIVEDFDKDGRPDILIGGNYFSYKTQLGKDDASVGLLLKGRGNRTFQPVAPYNSGCYMGGDVRRMIEIKSGENKRIIAGKNEDKVQVIQWNTK